MVDAFLEKAGLNLKYENTIRMVNNYLPAFEIEKHAVSDIAPGEKRRVSIHPAAKA